MILNKNELMLTYLCLDVLCKSEFNDHFNIKINRKSHFKFKDNQFYKLKHFLLKSFKHIKSIL